MTHTHWLCAVWWGGFGGTSPSPPAEDLFWLAHRGCQCRFFSLRVGILFIYLLFRSSRQKNQFCPHLSGRPLMVFDGLGEGVGECVGIEQVPQSFVSQVGWGDAGVFLFLFHPSLWGIRGQGGLQRVAITSAQPLLSGILLLSSFLSFSLLVGVRIVISRAYCCL